MKDIQAGLEILNETITKKIVHQDYERVTALAQEYYDIFTGAGIEPYLRKYRANESDQMFKQMLTIYEPTIPAVVHNLDTIFERPLRSNRIFSSIDHESNQAREEIVRSMQEFWQGETESGLDAYLRERWKHFMIYDPNAFIAIEFANFDPVKDKAKSFAIEYSSEKVIRFNYIKGILDYLVIEEKILYQRQGPEEIEWIPGSQYVMYLENDAIVFTEIDIRDRLTDIPNPTTVDIFEDGSKIATRVFVQQIFQTKSEVVPAFRIGYMLDPVTSGRTNLSSIHYALAFFKKELKSGVELDLTIRAHVFPQKYMYGPKCEGDKENSRPCMNGKTTNGDTCAICGGTGVLPVHTTAQDVIVFPMPKTSNDPVINLQQAMAYFSPPLELVKFMEEYCDRLTEKAKMAVFPAQSVVRQKIEQTATEQTFNWDNVNNALRPFCAKYSYAWLFVVKMIAIYTDNPEGLTLFHKFASDLKLKGIEELLDEAKKAMDSGMPQHIKSAINDDLARLYYADDPDSLLRLETKNKFHPFSGKSEAEVQSIIMGEEILPFYKVLYIYFDVIFDLIESEMGDKFYLLAPLKQKGEVKRQVDLIIQELDKIKAKSLQGAQTLFNQPLPEPASNGVPA